MNGLVDDRRSRFERWKASKSRDGEEIRIRTSGGWMKLPAMGCCIIHALHFSPPKVDKREALNLSKKKAGLA